MGMTLGTSAARAEPSSVDILAVSDLQDDDDQQSIRHTVYHAVHAHANAEDIIVTT